MKSAQNSSSRRSQGHVERYVADLQSAGRYSFDERELRAAVPLSPHGIERALARLRREGRILRPLPKRGFFIIVPAEFRTLGAPPITWYVEGLMRFLNAPDYYIGLLSAAEWHGASHFAVQEVQVVTPRQLRAVTLGRERIRFVRKRGAAATPVQVRTTDAGTVRVSAPEATALDLARYTRVSGGLDVVATALAELKLRSAELRKVLDSAGEVAVAQRLGYLLEHVGQAKAAKVVAVWLARQARVQQCALDPTAPRAGAELAQPWRVLVNADVHAAA